MATYTHFETANSPTYAWQGYVGDSYTATSSQVIITNTDGTLTKLLGSFTVAGGVVTGGTITSMLHTNSNQAVTYESITGASADAAAFLSAPDGDAKFALVLSGADTMNGYSGDDRLNGYGSNDTMAGGDGDDVYYVDSIGDAVVENFDKGTDRVITLYLSLA